MRYQYWFYSSVIGALILTGLGIEFYKSSLPIALPTHHSIPRTLPTEIRRCLPAQGSWKLQAKVTASGIDYYAVGSHFPEGYRQFLIALNSHSQCHSLLPDDRRLPDNFLSAYVSEALARQVMLQFYLSRIQQAGGKEVFQQQFWAKSRSLNTEKAYLSPEQGWALGQLGISIPKNIRVISATEYLKLL